MGWYYAKDGQQLGPVSEGELRELAGRGEISESTLVWSEGMSEWKAYSVALGRPADAASAGMPAVSTPPSQYVGSIETYMTRSILTAVAGFFCCQISMILGIIAIVMASQSSDALKRGDYATAVQNSERARQFCSIGMWLLIPGVLFTIVIIAIQFVAIASGV